MRCLENTLYQIHLILPSSLKYKSHVQWIPSLNEHDLTHLSFSLLSKMGTMFTIVLL